jgi:Fe-S cluster assembly iron-binding protein IscA
MINITKKATEKFNEIIRKAKSPEKIMLRLNFAGYG